MTGACLQRYRICINDNSTSGHHGFSEVNTRDLNGERKRKESRVPSYVLSRGRQINSHTGTSRRSKSERFIDEKFAEMPKVFQGVKDNEAEGTEY